jgi:hypothetical protein
MHPDLAWQIAQLQSSEVQRQLQAQRLVHHRTERSFRQQIAFRCGRMLLRCSRWLLRYGQPTVPARPTPRIR